MDKPYWSPYLIGRGHTGVYTTYVIVSVLHIWIAYTESFVYCCTFIYFREQVKELTAKLQKGENQLKKHQDEIRKQVQSDGKFNIFYRVIARIRREMYILYDVVNYTYFRTNFFQL